MHLKPTLLLAILLLVPLAGCLGDGDKKTDTTPPTPVDVPPYLGYVPDDPDFSLQLIQESVLLPGDDVEIHARIVRPEGDGPFPVIVQFTPYTAPGRNTILETLAEPAIRIFADGVFESEFIRRGYAFAFADVRGTGDSSGCLDLRGAKDIADVGKLTQWLGTQPWSNGNVGYIGASYPGSEAHMAGIAGGEHLKAIVPIVASTSFYHYHHNDGVPYNGNHALGGTNTGYTRNALAPTVNPQHSNYGSRYVEEASQCDYRANMLDHGGLDQTGAYYDWWQERNLRPMAKNITVPVLMAQGLADWNVKPDHIATWFNDLTQSPSKTLIAGQWGHAYPREADEAYGDWWNYVTAFFDTFLKEIDTGMFQEESVAWVQDNNGTWHRSTDWPLRGNDAPTLDLYLTPDGRLTPDLPSGITSRTTWTACPHDRMNMGQFVLATVEAYTVDCDDAPVTSYTFTSEPFEKDTLVSGVPTVLLNLESTASWTHLTVVMDRIDQNGNVVQARENYGYLNPTFRHGIDNPTPVPIDATYDVIIDMYPQEELVKAGERLRITIASNDNGRTIEAYEEGENTLVYDATHLNVLTLPLRSAHLEGVRLPDLSGDEES